MALNNAGRLAVDFSPHWALSVIVRQIAKGDRNEKAPHSYGCVDLRNVLLAGLVEREGRNSVIITR